MLFPQHVERVAFAGDWHGDTGFAVQAVRCLAGRGIQVIIQVGDFGDRYQPDYLDRLNAAAEKADVLVLFADGNHEDFDYLLAQPVDDDGVRRLRPRIWHLPRGFRWEWQGLRFLALGGAHSVNKPDLMPGWTWWPQETITQAEAYRACSGGPVDVMVTHDCPSNTPIPGLAGGEIIFGAEQIRLAEQHRALLGAVVDEVQPRHLWHGHYHRRYQAERHGCLVRGLGCNLDGLGDNIDVVDLTDLL